MKHARLTQQIQFIVEIDKLKHIFRRSYLVDGTRKENDAEHSWHITLMAVILQEYADSTSVNVLKVIKMLLLHDIVEIDAGDVIIYDKEQRKAQEQKERKAAERLFSILPEDQKKEFHALWLEFEERKTADAQFARVLDRLQPILLNFYAKGKTWQESGIAAGNVLEVNSIINDGSKELWAFVENLIQDAIDKKYLKA